MSLFLMSLLGGGGRGSKQIKPMSLYILFFLLMASLKIRDTFALYCYIMRGFQKCFSFFDYMKNEHTPESFQVLVQLVTFT